MSSGTGIWLRQEASPNERRTPLVPADTAGLMAAGLPVTVEESAHRAFAIDEYAAAGCRVMPAGSWPDAPLTDIVLGLKAPVPPHPLNQRHVFFGHAYKGQRGGPMLLRRFAAGGGTLLDLEHLTDEAGRRVVAFGFWAGYAGAALAVLHHRGELGGPLSPTTRADFDARLRAGGTAARAVVIGALGRSGRGACEALSLAGAKLTEWDIDETGDLDLPGLLAHDILVNAVHTIEPGTPFLTTADLARPRSLTVVADITCDMTSACNRLPVNDKVTDWLEPARRLHAGPPPLDVLAIDNLPSLIPRESSADFSARLVPHLAALPHGSPVWDRCLARFHHARTTLTSEEETWST